MITSEEIFEGRKEHYRMQRESGYMSVEASISLTIFLFMMMFMMNFGQIYRIQNYINHNLYQAGKMVSFYSFDYSNRVFVEDIITFIKSLSNTSVALEAEWVRTDFPEGDNKDFSRVVKMAFDNLDPNLSQTLSAYGVEEVLIDEATVSEQDMNVRASYTVKLRFQFLGIEKITMNQQMKCGLWIKGED